MPTFRPTAPRTNRISVSRDHRSTKIQIEGLTAIMLTAIVIIAYLLYLLIR